MWTKLYWAQVLERAIKTFAQAAIALITADQTGVVPLPTGWQDVAKVAAITAVLSLVTSIVSTPVGGSGPSLVPGPADAALDTLSTVTRGLVRTARQVTSQPAQTRTETAQSAVLQAQADRAVEAIAEAEAVKPRAVWSRRTWARVIFLALTALTIGHELWYALDSSDQTEPWTDLIVTYVPWEAAVAVFGLLLLWVPVHFLVRYRRAARR